MVNFIFFIATFSIIVSLACFGAALYRKDTDSAQEILKFTTFLFVVKSGIMVGIHLLNNESIQYSLIFKYTIDTVLIYLIQNLPLGKILSLTRK